MNKEFVPYEQALDLKELGFDDECFGSFKGDVRYLDYANIHYCNNMRRTLAPTFSQAFRWFREKYGFHITIHTDKWCEISKDGWVLKDTYSFDTYEEAELVCLKKLIELCKNN